MKFKIGDKVRCIKGDYKGVIGTISEIQGDDIYCDDWSDNEDGYLKKNSLELIKPKNAIDELKRLLDL